MSGRIQGSVAVVTGGRSGTGLAPAARFFQEGARGFVTGRPAAVRSFARSWAVDLKERKIRVNAVSAGVIPTRGYESAGLTREQIEAFAAQMAPLIPLGRVGTPEEVAKAVLFLASRDSSFVNGAELFVDGGMAQV